MRSFLAMLRNKKDIIILCLLLLVLILPRIAVYPALGAGLVGSDAQLRYLPQAEELSKSWAHFFTQTGPLYSAFLMFFGKITHDMVTGPVIVQHLLGIVTALLVFFYFRKVSLALALIVTTFLYASILAVYLEHWIMREAMASFFLVMLVVLLSLAARDTKYLKFIYGFWAGLTGVILIFIRIEFITLVILIPLILYIVKKRENHDFKLWDKALIKWTGGYVCLALVICGFVGSMFVIAPGQLQIGTDYGSYFKVAYYSLEPDVFYYNNSHYPDLLERYQTVLKNGSGRVGESMSAIYATTEEYLSEHNELKFTSNEMLDKMYIDMMTRNTPVYLKSLALNLGNQLLGRGEAEYLTETNIKITSLHIVENNGVVNGVDMGGGQTTETDKTGGFWRFLLNLASQVYSVAMALVYKVLLSSVFAWLLLPSLVFMFIKWKTLPAPVIIAFLISAIPILTLAFLANPIHRFRYPIDPFLYFIQIYLILLLLNTMFSRPIRLIRARFHPAKLADNLHDVS